MKNKIAIIGAAGNMGSNIARNLAQAGHSLFLVDHHPEKLAALVQEIKTSASSEVSIVSSPEEASQQADIIIPAVGYAEQPAVAHQIKPYVSDKIVVSLVNPLNRTYDGLLTNPITSAAEELAQLLPNVHVVKAFNTVLAADFQHTVLDGKTIDCFVAGDDEPSVNTITDLVHDAGFNVLVAGPLATSRTLENMTVMLIGLSQRYQYDWVAGWKVLHRAARQVAVLLLMLFSLGFIACTDNESPEPDYTSQEVDSLRALIAEITAQQEAIAQNLETFDTLDFEVFTNQQWSRVHESHSQDVIVHWPDGRVTEGIDTHIEDMAALFVHAPDSRILQHPIRFGSGNYTAVTGIFEGTFTEPLPIGNGEFIEPTGKSFKVPMATIGLWRDGTMYEEFLYWDNQLYAQQIGL